MKKTTGYLIIAIEIVMLAQIIVLCYFLQSGKEAPFTFSLINLFLSLVLIAFAIWFTDQKIKKEIAALKIRKDKYPFWKVYLSRDLILLSGLLFYIPTINTGFIIHLNPLFPMGLLFVILFLPILITLTVGIFMESGEPVTKIAAKTARRRKNENS